MTGRDGQADLVVEAKWLIGKQLGGKWSSDSLVGGWSSQAARYVGAKIKQSTACAPEKAGSWEEPGDGQCCPCQPTNLTCLLWCNRSLTQIHIQEHIQIQMKIYNNNSAAPASRQICPPSFAATSLNSMLVKGRRSQRLLEVLQSDWMSCLWHKTPPPTWELALWPNDGYFCTFARSTLKQTKNLEAIRLMMSCCNYL